MIARLLDELMDEESAETEIIEIEDKRRLGIATLGALKQHLRISSFRQFVEGWYLTQIHHLTVERASVTLVVGWMGSQLAVSVLI